MSRLGIIHAKRLLSRQVHNRKPDDEGIMSCQFARILERELQAAGLSSSAVSACASDTAPVNGSSFPVPAGGGADLRLDVPDRTDFSARAITLSSSLRQYARDAHRPGRSDPSLITGWNEAGYLRDTGQGLSGEIRFTTASGVTVIIAAGTGDQGRADIRVRAARDGVEHSFSLDDFSACRREEAKAPASAPIRAALPGGAEAGSLDAGRPGWAEAYPIGKTGGNPAASLRPLTDLVC